MREFEDEPLPPVAFPLPSTADECLPELPDVEIPPTFPACYHLVL